MNKAAADAHLIIIRQQHLSLDSVAVGDGVDKGIKIECRQIWILSLDVEHNRGVVPAQVYILWHIVEQVWEGYAVLSSDLMPHNDLVYVIKLIPVLVCWIHILNQRLKLGTSG